MRRHSNNIKIWKELKVQAVLSSKFMYYFQRTTNMSPLLDMDMENAVECTQKIGWEEKNNNGSLNEELASISPYVSYHFAMSPENNSDTIYRFSNLFFFFWHVNMQWNNVISINTTSYLSGRDRTNKKKNQTKNVHHKRNCINGLLYIICDNK